SARLACLTRQQILVYSLFLKGQISLFIRFMPGSPGTVVIKANLLTLSFVFFFPQELFFKESIVRIISISAGKKDKTFSIFFFKIKTDPKVYSKIGCYLPNIDRRLLQFTNDFL
ncbi:hypothetical protein LUB13_08590, partial [Lactobacillus delbrueckii subsp. lactis]